MTALCKGLAGAVLLGLAGAAQAGPLDFDELMKILGQRSSGQARFVEERHVAGLDRPLKSAGRLTFDAPDRFGRHVESPRPESVEVEGDMVVLKRGGRTREIRLDAIPELQAMVAAIRGTLSGNGALLRQHFAVQVSGTGEQWSLGLRPVDDRSALQVAEVIIGGRLADVRSIELRTSAGDRSIMQVDRATALTGSR